MAPKSAAGRAAFDSLRSSRAQFHESDERRADWTLSGAALEWLFAHLVEGSRTLETGSGYSTVVFALRGTEYISISPAPHEHKRLRDWCQEHGVDTDHVRFMDATSQDVLPHLHTEPLDFVLIDGDHAFPIPFLDWYYTATLLRVGGLVFVDDTDIRSGQVLRDFLEAESARWALRSVIGRAVVVEKLAPDVVGIGFTDQRGTGPRQTPEILLSRSHRRSVGSRAGAGTACGDPEWTGRSSGRPRC